MPATKLNIVIEQGADFGLSLIYQDDSGVPISLVGYSAKAQVRPAPGSVELILDMGTIALGGVAGTIDIAVAAANTAPLVFTTGVWDLLLTSPGGAKQRLLEGNAVLDPAVTV